MKKGIHPDYELAIIRCACGHEAEIRTTRPGINVEICGNCHPFYTGKQKLVDTAGRVDRFRKRYGLAEEDSTSEAIARGEKLRQDKEARTKKRTKTRPEAKAEPKKPRAKKLQPPTGESASSGAPPEAKAPPKEPKKKSRATAKKEPDVKKPAGGEA